MTKKMPNPRATERGNAFIFILMGVALFAALSFTVARGMRSQTTNALSARDAELAATEIVTYAQKVARAVDRVRRKGCSENEINFYNEVVAGYTNPDAPGDNSCDIFHPAGGAVSFETPPQNFFAPGSGEYLFGMMCGRLIGTSPAPWNDATCNTDSVANQHAELVFVANRIKTEICEKINQKLHNDPTIPADKNHLAQADKFQGSFNEGAASLDSSTINDEIDSRMTGCVAPVGGGGINVFYSVLLAR